MPQKADVDDPNPDFGVFATTLPQATSYRPLQHLEVFRSPLQSLGKNAEAELDFEVTREKKV